MRKRQSNRPSDDNDNNNQDFWEQIWGAYRQHSSIAAQDDRRPTGRTATATNTASTVWSTAYITIHVPVATLYPTTAPISTRLRANSSSTASYSVISSWPASSSIRKSPTSTWVAPSSIATASADSATLISGLKTEDNAAVSAAPTADTTMGAIANSLEPERKRAIIGGLSGTIAGLVVVGLLIFLVLRRRRKQKESRDSFEATMHNGDRDSCPEVREKFAGFVTVKPFGRGSPRSSHVGPPSTTQIAVDEDHRMIRMSTRHWPRPYAVGEGEGYRESVPFGQLRVVNPDLSRPTTPRRPSTETVGSYFRKQQSALAGFVFNVPRSARQSRGEQTMRIRETPTITVVDPTLSRECVLGSTTTLSFGSYPSLVSLPIVKQHPLEDAFLTPTQNSSKQLGDVATAPAAARPSISPLQSAAGTATRALSQLSSTLLQPLRSKSNNTPSTPQQPAAQAAHLSTSTYSSRMSRRSDPFDLDRPSLRGSHHAAAAAATAVNPRRNSRLSLYEGT